MDGDQKGQPSKPQAPTSNQSVNQPKKLDSNPGNAERLPKEGEPHALAAGKIDERFPTFLDCNKTTRMSV